MEEKRIAETMPRKSSNWLWGALLIGLGVAFLLGQSGLFPGDDLAPMVVMAGIGATFFIVHRMHPERRWAQIVAFVIWFIAGGILLDEVVFSGPLRRYDDLALALYFGTAFSLPFLIAHNRSGKSWLLIFPAMALAGMGAALIDEAGAWLGRYDDAALAVYVTSVLAMPLFIAYYRTRKVGWLIPATLLLMTSGGIAIDELAPPRFDDELLGAYLTGIFSLPFILIYLRDRSRWWALIPAGILIAAFVGFVISGLTPVLPVLMIGIGVFLLIRPRLPRASRPNEMEPISVPERGPEADHAPVR